jgi:glycosyltransferase involved in cell wall biosynthesis
MRTDCRSVTTNSTTSPRLSALLVVHNEEAQLAACLETVKFADEIVVVLDRCTDSSKDIAERFAARLIEGAWELEGLRRNTGIDACTGDWILEVDADERVTPKLAAEIRATIATAPYGHFLIPFDNYVGDHLVKYGWGASWGVSATVRLFAKGPDGPAKKWGDQRVHPRLELKGSKGTLKEPMAHYVDRDISDMLQRLDRYTSARAKDLRASGDIGSFGRNVRRIFSRFWKCYVSRRGYREGAYGFLIALMAGLYPILSYLKARYEDD